MGTFSVFPFLFSTSLTRSRQSGFCAHHHVRHARFCALEYRARQEGFFSDFGRNFFDEDYTTLHFKFILIWSRANTSTDEFGIWVEHTSYKIRSGVKAKVCSWIFLERFVMSNDGGGTLQDLNNDENFQKALNLKEPSFLSEILNFAQIAWSSLHYGSQINWHGLFWNSSPQNR